MFTNSNWFAFQENGTIDESLYSEKMDEIDLNGTATVSNGGSSSSSDDEVVVGEDGELADTATSTNGASGSDADCIDKPSTKNVLMNGGGYNCGEGHSSGLEKPCISHDLSLARHETTDGGDFSGDRPLPNWVTWCKSSDFQVDGLGRNPLKGNVELDHYPRKAMGPLVDCLNGGVKAPNSLSSVLASGDGPVETGMNQGIMPSLFEEEFVGVDLEGTKKAMDQALKEGIVGEANC